MKIAITVDPDIPVPPPFYGGIERIVSMLIDEYIDLGHEITLFAHRDSVTKAKLIPYKRKSSSPKFDTLMNMVLISKEIYSGKFDIIHSFSRLAYLTLLLPLSIPKIMSYQRQPTISQIIKALKISYKRSLSFTGCSNYISYQIKPYAATSTVYNGFPEDTYQLSENIEEDAPLVFLGRIEPIKGTHHAIKIALGSRKNLIIAGNIPTEYQTYYQNSIAPYIDNKQIFYIGAVNDIQKARILKSAIALLMPIDWDEPFGIVMVEAMACGTPVIALARGAAPEIVKNGTTGYLCKNIDECIEKVAIVGQLNRAFIREEAVIRFGSKIIANNYLDLYEKCISQAKVKKHPNGLKL